MRTIPMLLPALACAALAGCGDGGAPANDTSAPVANAVVAPASAPTTRPAPAIAIEDGGLRLVDPATGAARPLAFGTPEAATLAALASAGTPETGRNDECPAGPVTYADYPDGLMLTFQDGAFAGWSLDGRRAPKLTTLSGVGIGSTRAAVEAANAITVTDGSLGAEFALGEMGGLLDGTAPTAKVTNLWAGVTCIAR